MFIESYRILNCKYLLLNVHSRIYNIEWYGNMHNFPLGRLNSFIV